MARVVKKTRTEILREALAKLEGMTPVRSTGPGSIARAFTEAMAVELGDTYNALDYNLNQALLSSASGTALDMIGSMYNVTRKTASDSNSLISRVGSFYFYVDTPALSDITIPIGTKVYTSVDSFIGRQFSFETTADTTIRIGNTRAWTSLKPTFSTAEFTAAADTLLVHDFPNPAGVLVRCTNPKPIAPQIGLEGDDEYRARIKKQIRVASSGTHEAIRFAGLSAPGVRDVKIRQRVFGMGSFEALVIPEETSASQSAYASAIEFMNRVAPVGVRMWTARPTYVPFDIEAQVIFDTAQTNPQQITRQAKVAVTRYINSLMPGESIVYNKVITAIMDTAPALKDVVITEWSPNGVPSTRRNWSPKDDEMIVPGSISVNYAR